MAAELGYFADVGINVTITSPLYPVRSVVYVEDRTVDIGVSHQPQVVMGQEEGESLVAVGSLISQPTAAMIWLEKSQIRSIADLKGRTVAIPDLPFQEEFLGALLARAGLTLEDVEVEVVGYELVPALISGQADAIFGGSWNVEGAELESRGLKPVVTRVQSLGIPAYDELVVIARSDLVAKDPELIREFMAAVARGTAAAVKDPKGVVEAIEQSYEKDPESTRKGIEAGVEATLPLLSRTGYMDPGQADRLVDWMHEQGLIEEEPAAAAFLTNSCLPRS